MGFILPRNPVIRMANRLCGLLRPLPFLLLSLVKRKDAMSRGMMLLVLAAVVGYSANRFDVLENAVPAMKAVGVEVASAAKAVGTYVWEGKPGVDVTSEPTLYWMGRVGVWFAAAVCCFWAAIGFIPDEGKPLGFPGGFQILAEDKYWRVWAVALVTLLLPLEAVSRLVYIAIHIVLDPCIFVYRLTVRGLNYDLSKLAGSKAAVTDPSDPSPTESPEPPQSLRSHWDPTTENNDHRC